MRARLAGRVALALLLVSAGASAQSGVSGSQGAPWVPTLSIDPSSLPVIEGTATPRGGDVDVGLTLEWFDTPVRGRVDGRFVGTLSTQVGLPKHVALGLQVPVVGYQVNEGAGAATPGLGDIRGLLRWAPRSMPSTMRPAIDRTDFCGQGRCSHNWDVGFALSLAGTVPTAAVAFAGHGAPTARLDATFEVRSFRYGAVVSAGYLTGFDAWPAQEPSCPVPGAMCSPAVDLRDRLIFSLGLRHPLGALLGALGGIVPVLADAGTLLTFITENTIGSPYFTFVASLDGRDPFHAPAALEVGFGSQRRIGSFTFTAGGSWGLGDLFDGSYRVTVGVQWQPPEDEDNDGVGDDADECLGAAGPTVSHGCPDEYNDPDRDGLRFPIDQCPTLAEDGPGVDDGDGCPDQDTDDDGVPDARDICPCTPTGPRVAREPSRRGCPLGDESPAPSRACLGAPDGGVPPADASTVDAPSAPRPTEGRPYSNEAH